MTNSNAQHGHNIGVISLAVTPTCSMVHVSSGDVQIVHFCCLYCNEVEVLLKVVMNYQMDSHVVIL